MSNDYVIIVSGFPRSGTSMMMQMLKAGGVELLIDGIREADVDNPKGYYEYEKVKRLQQDNSWVRSARGKAIKVVSPLLKYLPGEITYRTIFMLRDLTEVLASQQAMLGKTVEDSDIYRAANRQIKRDRDWLALQSNFSTLFLHYEDVVASPLQGASAVSKFLSDCLEEQAMASAVDPSLYRQRRTRELHY